jgi:hypothetical protein
LRQASRERGGAQIAAALRERRAEIEGAILIRVHAVSELPPRGGPEYAEGLRAAVAAGVEYGLEGIERGEQSAPPVPEALLAQARLAARSGVSLDTVLRRYFAGHVLIEDFMVEEAERTELLGPAELKRLLRSQAAIVDRLLAVVSEAYAEEAKRRPQGAERRKAERIERLLAGEPLDTAEIGYGFDGWHLGIVCSGQGGGEMVASLARSLDARPLLIDREEGVLWGWLGSGERCNVGEVLRLASREVPEGLALALGEPGEGMSGWKLSHRQAGATLPVALRGHERVVRYREVAMLAAVLQDELLATSLRQLFLIPLEAGRDGGETLRQTLVAYFASGWSASAAAALLGVKRHTVSIRLRTAEELIGRPISTCASELEMAMRLWSFEAGRSGRR